MNKLAVLIGTVMIASVAAQAQHFYNTAANVHHAKGAYGYNPAVERTLTRKMMERCLSGFPRSLGQVQSYRAGEALKALQLDYPELSGEIDNVIEAHNDLIKEGNSRRKTFVRGKKSSLYDWFSSMNSAKENLFRAVAALQAKDANAGQRAMRICDHVYNVKHRWDKNSYYLHQIERVYQDEINGYRRNPEINVYVQSTGANQPTAGSYYPIGQNQIVQ